DILARRRIQFAQEREPWFWNTFIRMHRQDPLPSCQSGDSNVLRRASDVRAATLSPLESSSRGRRYLRAQGGNSPQPPTTTEVSPSARSLSSFPIVRSP